MSLAQVDYSRVEASVSSALRGVAPARSQPVLELSDYLLPASASLNIDKASPEGYSALVVSVKAGYASAATAGVRLYWLYSPDGSNYDSLEDAQLQSNYYDLSFTAGAVRQATVLVPLLAPYVRLVVVNKDTSVAVLVTVWTWFMR